jgi:hypothetical protein
MQPSHSDPGQTGRVNAHGNERLHNKQEIRPTFGELMKAASDAFRVFVRDGIRHIRPGLVVNTSARTRLMPWWALRSDSPTSRSTPCGRAAAADR